MEGNPPICFLLCFSLGNRHKVLVDRLDDPRVLGLCNVFGRFLFCDGSKIFLYAGTSRQSVSRRRGQRRRIPDSFTWKLLFPSNTAGVDHCCRCETPLPLEIYRYSLFLEDEPSAFVGPPGRRFRRRFVRAPTIHHISVLTFFDWFGVRRVGSGATLPASACGG